MQQGTNRRAARKWWRPHWRSEGCQFSVHNAISRQLFQVRSGIALGCVGLGVQWRRKHEQHTREGEQQGGDGEGESAHGFLLILQVIWLTAIERKRVTPCSAR